MGADDLVDLQMVTVEEVAALLKVSKMTVYRMCDAGDLPSRRTGKNGRLVRIPEAAVRRYLEEVA